MVGEAANGAHRGNLLERARAPGVAGRVVRRGADGRVGAAATVEAAHEGGGMFELRI